MFSWEHITQYLDIFSDEKKPLAKVLRADGIKIGKQEINTSGLWLQQWFSTGILGFLGFASPPYLDSETLAMLV